MSIGSEPSRTLRDPVDARCRPIRPHPPPGVFPIFYTLSLEDMCIQFSIRTVGCSENDRALLRIMHKYTPTLTHLGRALVKEENLADVCTQLSNAPCHLYIIAVPSGRIIEAQFGRIGQIACAQARPELVWQIGRPVVSRPGVSRCLLLLSSPVRPCASVHTKSEPCTRMCTDVPDPLKRIQSDT